MSLANDPELDAQLYLLSLATDPSLDTLPSLSGARLLLAANDESLDPLVRQRASTLYLQKHVEVRNGTLEPEPEDAVLRKPLSFTLPDHDLGFATGWQLLLMIFNTEYGDVDFIKTAQRRFTKNAIDFQTRHNTGQLPRTSFPPPEPTSMLLDSPPPSSSSDDERFQLLAQSPSLGPTRARGEQPEPPKVPPAPPTSRDLPSPLHQSSLLQDPFATSREPQQADPMRQAPMASLAAGVSGSLAQGGEEAQMAEAGSRFASSSQALPSENVRAEETASTTSEGAPVPSSRPTPLPPSERKAAAASLIADYTLIPEDGLDIISAKGVEITFGDFGARASFAEQTFFAFKAEDVIRASYETGDLVGERMACTVQFELQLIQIGDGGKIETDYDLRVDLGMREERDSQLEALFAVTDRWKAKNGISVQLLTAEAPMDADSTRLPGPSETENTPSGPNLASQTEHVPDPTDSSTLTCNKRDASDRDAVSAGDSRTEGLVPRIPTSDPSGRRESLRSSDDLYSVPRDSIYALLSPDPAEPEWTVGFWERGFALLAAVAPKMELPRPHFHREEIFQLSFQADRHKLPAVPQRKRRGSSTSIDVLERLAVEHIYHRVSYLQQWQSRQICASSSSRSLQMYIQLVVKLLRLRDAFSRACKDVIRSVLQPRWNSQDTQDPISTIVKLLGALERDRRECAKWFTESEGGHTRLASQAKLSAEQIGAGPARRFADGLRELVAVEDEVLRDEILCSEMAARRNRV